MELSRNFKALKVWMSLKEHGIEKYATMVRKNLAQAQYLADLYAAILNWNCWPGYRSTLFALDTMPANRSEEELNIINKEILMRLQEEGIAAPSYTLLHNKYAIRAAITNHRSRLQDFDALVRETIRIGRTL